MDKLTIEKAQEELQEVANVLADPEHLLAFVTNIDDLGKYKDDWDLFDWLEAYLAWSEMSTREDMEWMYG